MAMRVRIGGVVALLGTAATLAACGGDDGDGNEAASEPTASAAEVGACAKRAGFDVRDFGPDPSLGKTGHLLLNKPGNTISVAFLEDESAAEEYLEATGGPGPHEGPEPGGNERIGTAVVSYYAKGADLTRVEDCIRV